MHRPFLHRALTALLLCPFTAEPAAAILQPTSAEQATPADPKDIIITARRMGERLGRSALPVSVIDGESLRERGLTQMPSLQEAFPALAVQPTSTGNLLFIRGVGNFTLLPNSDPAAATGYDGVFVARPIGTTTQYFDLNRIELLKGPQGVLYGRNASAGSINIEPRHPVIGDTSANLHLSLASFEQRRAEGAANVTLGKNAALRLSALLAGQDHFLKGYAEGQRESAVRAQVKMRAGPTTIRLSADHAQLSGTGIGTSYLGNYVYSAATGSYRFIDSNLPLSEGLYSRSSQTYRQTIFLPPGGRNLDALASRPRQNNRFSGVHAHVEADLAIGQLTLIPAWRQTRVDLVAAGPPFGLAQDDDLEQFSLESRLAGRAGPVDWLVGTFLFRETIDSFSATNLSSSLILTQQAYRTHSAALFGHATIRVARGLRLNGGARWTRDRKSFDSRSNSLAIICQQFASGRPSCPTVPLLPLVKAVKDVPFTTPTGPNQTTPILVSGLPTGAISIWSSRNDKGRLVDQAMTWRAGAEADVSDGTLLYASTETGYRPGGFNAATGFETFEPERITALTLGLRHRSRDRRLAVDLEAFRWNYRNQQVSSLRPDLSPTPRNANITDNIAGSLIRGIEADLRFRPWTRTEIGAVVQYLDSEYRSFRYIQVSANAPPLTGCKATRSGASNLYEVDCSAKQPFNSPRWSILLSASQAVALGDWTLTFAADTHFRTGRNIGFAFLPQQRIGSTSRSNLRLSALPAHRRFELGAFVRNLENDRVPDFVIFHPASNAVVAGTTAPTTYGLWLLARL